VKVLVKPAVAHVDVDQSKKADGNEAETLLVVDPIPK
jgi:hypothetical protein